jgi:hypothetical protein
MFIYCDQVENLAIHMRVYWLSWTYKQKIVEKVV